MRFLPKDIDYSVTEKQFLSKIWALERFKYFLHLTVVIRNDHRTLNLLLSQKETTGILARWVMKLLNSD